MAILAGEIVTAARLNRLQPTTYTVASSGNITLTTSMQDVTGASITLSTATANAVYVAIATFDILINTAQAGQLAEGYLDVDGVSQTRRALKSTAAVDRVTVTQHWRGTLASAGSHTIKLRGLKSGVSNSVTIVNTHTTLDVTIYEVV